MVDFFTSKTGVFAAVVAILGVVTAVVGLVRPWLQSRREQRNARAEVALTSPLLSDLSSSSNAYELRFEIANTGGRSAVVVAVRLRVLSRCPSTQVMPTVHAAPLRVNQHRVKLDPERSSYDVRARAYGPELPPLALAEAEVEVFVVKLVADVPQKYTVVVETDWFDAKVPAVNHTSVSDQVEIDFPPRESIGPPPTTLAD